MNNIDVGLIIKQSLINSIKREELLLKKYEEYHPNIDDLEIEELLKEFKKTATDHIDLLKGKLQKTSI